MLKAYRVSFFKTIFDSTGHPFHAAQGIVEMRLTSREDAVKKARKAFASLKGASDWSFHADYETVQAISPRLAIQQHDAAMTAARFAALSPRSTQGAT